MYSYHYNGEYIWENKNCKFETSVNEKIGPKTNNNNPKQIIIKTYLFIFHKLVSITLNIYIKIIYLFIVHILNANIIYKTVY